MPNQSGDFFVKDCALVAIATGVRAQVLSEFRDQVATIHPGSIYFHFWGGRLRPDFEHREYHNDFASWAHSHLHDQVLAERLDIIDPTDYEDLEDLRAEFIEVLDERLDEREYIPWTTREEGFQFIRSKIIIMKTSHQLSHPQELSEHVSQMSHSSLFYHFIDSRRRIEGGRDDFSNWLSSFGDDYQDVVEQIRDIDPYFISLGELQKRLTFIFEDHFL